MDEGRGGKGTVICAERKSPLEPLHIVFWRMMHSRDPYIVGAPSSQEMHLSEDRGGGGMKSKRYGNMTTLNVLPYNVRGLNRPGENTYKVLGEY